MYLPNKTGDPSSIPGTQINWKERTDSSTYKSVHEHVCIICPHYVSPHLSSLLKPGFRAWILCLVQGVGEVRQLGSFLRVSSFLKGSNHFCVCLSICVWVPEEGVTRLGTGVSGGCKTPPVGAGS